MRHACVGIAALALVLSAAIDAAGQRKGDKGDKGNVVGTRWRYELADGRKSKGVFRVHKYEIFQGAEKVGVVRPNGPNESTLVFTDLPDLNGEAKVRKIGMKPPVWVGALTRKDGSEQEIRFTVGDK